MQGLGIYGQIWRHKWRQILIFQTQNQQYSIEWEPEHKDYHLAKPIMAL